MIMILSLTDCCFLTNDFLPPPASLRDPPTEMPQLFDSILSKTGPCFPNPSENHQHSSNPQAPFRFLGSMVSLAAQS